MELFLFSEAEGGEQVVADFSACTFLLHAGEQYYDFCVTDGICNCNGEYTYTTQWQGSINNLTQNFWEVTDAEGNELYGGSGESQSAT